MDVYNGCATAATALQLTADAIRSGQYDIGVAVGMDKHAARRVHGRPRRLRRAALVRRDRALPHHEVLRHEDQPLHARPRHLATRRWRRWRPRTTATACSTRTPSAASRSREEEILGSRMLNYPLTQYMFCAPDEGAAAVVLCRADLAHRYTSTPIYLRATTLRTRRYGAFEVHALVGRGRAGRGADRLRLEGRLRAGRHRARGRRRHPAPGHRRRRRGHPHGRERLLRRRRAGEAHRRRRHRDRRAACRSTPTAASSPTASRSAPPACARCTSWCTSSGAPPATARSPASPKVGYAQLYGAPGTAGVSILTT